MFQDVRLAINVLNISIYAYLNIRPMRYSNINAQRANITGSMNGTIHNRGRLCRTCLRSPDACILLYSIYIYAYTVESRAIVLFKISSANRSSISGVYVFMGNIKLVLLSVKKLLVYDRVSTRKGTIIMSVRVRLILRYGPENMRLGRECYHAIYGNRMHYLVIIAFVYAWLGSSTGRYYKGPQSIPQLTFCAFEQQTAQPGI